MLTPHTDVFLIVLILLLVQVNQARGRVDWERTFFDELSPQATVDEKKQYQCYDLHILIDIIVLDYK